MNSDLKPPASKGPIVLLVIGLLVVLIGGFYLMRNKWPSIPGKPTPKPIPVQSGGTSQAGPASSGTPASEANLSIRLSEGKPLPRPFAPLPLATGEPLSPEEIQQILDRLPDLPIAPDDQTDFRIPVQPIPPPRTGETIQQPFPPAASPPETTPDPSQAGPLQVLRFSPEGEIPLAPFMSVTFNQPMVPLGTLADLAARDVPVQVDPPLPGTWRWLGTKTLTFEYDSALVDRLPMATVFHARVQAGVTSATGGVLAEPVEWSFSTPPPKAITMHPSGSVQPLDPLMFVAFDQRINPAAVIETIRLSAGGQPVSVVLASQEDIDANPEVSQMAASAQEGRWLAFRAAELLPAGSNIQVEIGPGTPSAEGPLVTQQAQSFSFSTYSPLKIEDYGCTGYDNTCRPLAPFFIRFNNPIDTAAYTETMLRVEPEIPGVSVNLYGVSLEIQGATRGQTAYQVTVSGEIQDIFGQTLGQDVTLTFNVGPAESNLIGPGQPLITLDPAAAKPVFSVYAINYKQLALKIYSVHPSDWPAFQSALQAWNNSDAHPAMPGSLLRDEPLPVEAPTDALTQVDIDLSEYLDGPSGHFILVVEPPQGLLESSQERWLRYQQTVISWVQVTQIGLDAFTDHSEMLIWATALKDGAPLAGVAVQPQTGGAEVLTGADGTARIPIPSGSTYLTARLGADQAILPRSASYWGQAAWETWPVKDELRWYVFDDRAMYRPGEEVHLKGWLRIAGGAQNGDLHLAGERVSSVSYMLTDPQGNELERGQIEVNAAGGFDFVITLPEEVNLGYAQLYFQALGDIGDLVSSQFYHGFQIQEFRRPEFEVTARNETTGPYFAGEFAVLAVEAKYYAGDPLPDANVFWQVTNAPASYTPPNWPDFVFGTWTPWWWWGRAVEVYESFSPPSPYGAGETEIFTGTTDETGTHYLRLDFDGSAGPKPVSVVANGTVEDVNRQAWSSTTTLLVHPANVYIGLRSQRYFVERGAPLPVDFIVTDLDGAPVAGLPVEVRAARLEWKYQNGEWQEVEADAQTCSLTSTSEPQTCTFETPVGGSYQITATVTDAQGRQNQSQMTRWVSGGELPPSRKLEQEKVTLIPDQETYQPGQVAEILVQSPFSPAEGLLTLGRNGMVSTERFRVEDGTATLRVPIQEAHIPNLTIQVDLAGAAPRTGDQGEPLPDLPVRPAFATGQLTLNISTLQRNLSLEVIPALFELEPGGETSLSITLRDAAGEPVPEAELAVIVVDEAILALTGYQLADPLQTFYPARQAGLESVYGRSSIILADPLVLASQAAKDQVLAERGMLESTGAGAPMPTMTAQAAMEAPAADAAQGAAPQPIRVRLDFNPLAVFAPSVRTDANGQAQVAVRVPDNLTRYRVMVVAVDSGGQRFGTGESSLTARLPLMVRPSAPRFLNFGDRFELPVVLQNQTADLLSVDVMVRAANLELTGLAGVRVSVPPHDRIEVRFPAAAQLAGVARVQLAAVSGSYADAAVVEMPVYTPATTEAFATYGVVDEGTVLQPLLAPGGVFPQFGGLEVNTSSTALQALTDAVLYLVSYPFECTEQLASRVIAIAALRDVLTAFQAEGLPAPEELEAAVGRDLERLAGLQNDDGGFPYWRRGHESIPFNTIHTAHALARAQAKGFAIPDGMQPRALDYLRSIESKYPSWYDQQTRWTLSAYSLYVRNLSGDRDAQKALRLLEEAGLENLAVEAVGWLWPVLSGEPGAESAVEAIRRSVNNRVVETPGAANFTTSYSDQTYLLLSSDRRTDAILLDALIGDSPQSDLIPKLVSGLLAHRTRGRWDNTQENVFVLLALDRYFNTYETQTPDFVARLWLGETYAGEFAFHGRTTDRQETLIPMTYVISETTAAGGTGDLILSKEGPGRLYYRLGLRYAPSELGLGPLDMGFVVQRRYEAVDDPADVAQDEQGIWHIKAGARVKVVVKMVASSRRYHVALVDPLPAGLEILNPALSVSQAPPTQDPGEGSDRYMWWWYWSWYEHQNLRDERAEAFTTLLWDGVYEYSYFARATTPGTFVVPPAKAEEMYSPEVFGRSASDWVVVE